VGSVRNVVKNDGKSLSISVALANDVMLSENGSI
jgi:hypothetical protein